MKIKVCGLKDPKNIQDVVALNPDFIGFIFYEQSPRYVGHGVCTVPVNLPSSIERVGVFVNASLDEIVKYTERYSVHTVQLSGNELPELCEALQQKAYQVIKAFAVDKSFDFSVMLPYIQVCDYFLFDTASPKHGGTGVQFNWDCLSNYPYAVPFLLSGGIDVKDAERIKDLNLPHLFAVDINSKFELQPGVKDIDKLNKFFNNIKC